MSDEYCCDHGYGDYGYGCSECESSRDMRDDLEDALERVTKAEARIRELEDCIEVAIRGGVDHALLRATLERGGRKLPARPEAYDSPVAEVKPTGHRLVPPCQWIGNTSCECGFGGRLSDVAASVASSPEARGQDTYLDRLDRNREKK